MTIKRSALISRKQLACLTGGKVDNIRHINALKVGTPFTYCGGGAIAMKDGIVHHICLKEKQNYPLPSSIHEEFTIYKKESTNGEKNDRLLHALKQAASAKGEIPIFWEPVEQKGKSPRVKSNGVSYVGHWTVVKVEDHSDNPIILPCLPSPRIAIIRLKFHEYNTKWSNIIHTCHDKSCEEIKAIEEELETHSAYDDSTFDGTLSSSDDEYGAVDNAIKKVINKKDEGDLKRKAKGKDNNGTRRSKRHSQPRVQEEETKISEDETSNAICVVSAMSETDTLPFLYFKVTSPDNSLNLSSIVLRRNKVTYKDIRQVIDQQEQTTLQGSSFQFDLGDDFIINPLQEEGLEVKDHSDGNGSRRNPFKIMIVKGSK